MRYPYIIAEAGSCHERDLSRALSLVYMAKHADADAVKFQYWSSASHMRARRRMEHDVLAYEAGSIPVEWFDPLQRTAHDIGLDFMCSAFLPEDVATVAEYVDHFKVSAFESGDDELAKAHHAYPDDGAVRHQVFVSVNAGKQASMQWWSGRMVPRFLHCVSEYPCPVENATLGKILDGYSDHTRTMMTGALAVAAGAQYVEVHFRLDDTSPTCPDYCVSLTPQELAEYVEGCRLAGVMRG